MEHFLLQLKRWREPDYPLRVEAVRDVLAGEARFTEEMLAFALNQHMHRLTGEALEAWIGGRRAGTPVGAPCCIGLRAAEAPPLAGLRPLLAAALMGHHVHYVRTGAADALLAAFVRDVQQEDGLNISLVTEDAAPSPVDAWIYWGVAPNGDESGGPSFVGPPRYGVAVIDGEESEAEREQLAEDLLLYDGRGAESVRLVWAPRGLAPDPYLEAMAAFRGVFPAHVGLAGTLEMQRAFLAAAGQSHAHGEGLEFLVSRGAPEAPPPGHARWAEYDAPGEVRTWVEAHAAEVELLAARPALLDRLRNEADAAHVRWCALGEAHRAPLGAGRDEVHVLRFLAALRC